MGPARFEREQPELSRVALRVAMQELPRRRLPRDQEGSTQAQVPMRPHPGSQWAPAPAPALLCSPRRPRAQPAAPSQGPQPAAPSPGRFESLSSRGGDTPNPQEMDLLLRGGWPAVCQAVRNRPLRKPRERQAALVLLDAAKQPVSSEQTALGDQTVLHNICIYIYRERERDVEREG